MKRRVAGVILIVLGAVVLVTPAGTAISQLGEETGEPVLTPGVVPRNPTPAESDGPELTAAQRTRAIELLETDFQAQRFLANRSYSVHDIGAWTTGGPNDQLIGALLIVSISPATSYPTMDWPTVEWDPTRNPPYRVTGLRLSASHVPQLMMNVDLFHPQGERVVGIQPGNKAQVTVAPNQTFAPDAVREHD